MRVFKGVDERYFNSECLYKVERLGLHIESFKQKQGGEYTCLAELCDSPFYQTFLQSYVPMVVGQPLALTSFDRIDSRFRDYDMLMAFVWDGGNLEQLLFSKETPDLDGLIKHVFSSSPQSFIVKSGLRPAEVTNKMYIRFVQELLEVFPDRIRDLLNGANQLERDRIYINLVNLSLTAGYESLNSLGIQKVPSLTSTCRLAGVYLENNISSMYLTEIRSHCPLEHGHKELTHFIANTFMSEAFRKSQECLDRNELMAYLNRRALAWAVHLRCPKNLIVGFIQQLTAISVCTSPDIYTEMGFSCKNLIGINVNIESFGIVKTVSHGPLAAFIKPNYNMSQTLNCLEFLHDIDRDFDLSDLYKDSGFRHNNAIKILAAIGGHCPGAELAIIDTDVEPENVLSLLKVIFALDCYDKYMPDSLVKIMSYYVDRMPLRGEDGVVKPVGGVLELTGDLREFARLEFRRACEKNPFFKEKLIEKIETLQGLTFDHLRAFGLSGYEMSKTMGNMSLKDRGSMLEDELGL